MRDSHQKKPSKSVNVFDAMSWWMSRSRSAKETAKLTGTVFRVKSPELDSVADVVECATGGHGRCADRACGCCCHGSQVRKRGKSI